MADAIDLGSIALTGVEVRVLSSAPWADGGPWPSGKASPLQGEDRRFESDRVHFPGHIGCDGNCHSWLWLKPKIAVTLFQLHFAGVVQW